MKLVSPFQRGDEVPVQMPANAGTGDLAEVQADVEALGIHGFRECALDALQELEGVKIFPHQLSH